MMSFIEVAPGRFQLKDPPSSYHRTYIAALETCMSELTTLFEKAKQACEGEFLLTLLRIKGLEGAGWDTFQNLQRVIKHWESIRAKALPEEQVDINLFIYGLITENSEIYEIVSNLLNVINGERFLVNNLVSKSPKEKVGILLNRANSSHFSLTCMAYIVDPLLRNAIFHSDYIVHGAAIHIRHRNHMKIYSEAEILTIFNQTLAFYEILSKLLEKSIASYKEPQTIRLHQKSNMGGHAKVIVREKYGLIGIRHNYSADQLEAGAIPWHLARVMPTELVQLHAGIEVFPAHHKRINLAWDIKDSIES